jgi:hypothetical protein
MDVKKEQPLDPVLGSARKITPEALSEHEGFSPSEEHRILPGKSSPKLSREERLSKERRERIRQFLKGHHRDKLYFPTEDIPSDMDYRWIREDCRGRHDLSRIALMTKKGWTPVPFDRHPHFLADSTWVFKDTASKPDVIRIDGLILCERPKEFGEIERESLETVVRETLEKVKWSTGEIDEQDRKVFVNKTQYEGEPFLE